METEAIGGDTRSGPGGIEHPAGRGAGAWKDEWKASGGVAGISTAEPRQWEVARNADDPRRAREGKASAIHASVEREESQSSAQRVLRRIERARKGASGSLDGGDAEAGVSHEPDASGARIRDSEAGEGCTRIESRSENMMTASG